MVKFAFKVSFWVPAVFLKAISVTNVSVGVFHKPILPQCSISIPSQNLRKSLLF